MLVYPNAKINIGLFVTEKRTDGFHDLETVFCPIGLSDILEIKEAEGKIAGSCCFKNTGILIDCPDEKNLVLKAYRLLDADFHLPAVNIHLHKLVPFGAGLGGGSADAAFTLKVLNELFALSLSEDRLCEYALKLGSDCAFFIKNRPVYAHGKGELMEDIPFSLKGYYLVLVKPVFGVSTPEAYRGIVPHPAAYDLRCLGELPFPDWKAKVKNDFEESVFVQYPEIGEIKKRLYGAGAFYASMTGSGSAVFGLFEKEIDVDDMFTGCFIWQEKLNI